MGFPVLPSATSADAPMAGTPAADLPLIPSASGIACRHHHHDLLFLLSLLNLGCLFFCLAPSSDPPPPPRRRKISPFSHPVPSPPAPSSSAVAKPAVGSSDDNGKSFSVSIRSYLRHLFSFSGPSPLQQDTQQEWAAASNIPASAHRTPPPPQQQQLRNYLLSPDKSITPCSSPAKSVGAVVDTCTVAVGPVKRPSFTSRADIYPCGLCGEVFNKPHLLDLHDATRHALSELSDGDSGKNIVTIIFRSGWKGGGGDSIHRVLKIHHSPRTLARFEEYRDAVRSRGDADERCVVDGNERLRFYCTTFLCGLAREGTCDSPFCAACGIVRHGFSGKDADGIATHATAWAAHASVPEELEREFAFMHVRRAMLVCRVVAGRVSPGKTAPPADADDGGCQYDSVVAAAAAGGGPWTGEGELVVFNARAVLPCFVVVYSGV